MSEIAAIVLAAGRSTRFGSDPGAGGGAGSKVFALLNGRPLVSYVVNKAVASRASSVVVVTGHGAGLMADVLKDLDVVLVHNPAFATGQGSSIRAGIAALPARIDGALILLADMPLFASSTIDTMIARYELDGPDVVVPLYGERRGNPVLLSRSLFPALQRLEGDEGARSILAGGSVRIARCSVDDPGVLIDIDTPEALVAAAARGEDETSW